MDEKGRLQISQKLRDRIQQLFDEHTNFLCTIVTERDDIQVFGVGCPEVVFSLMQQLTDASERILEGGVEAVFPTYRPINDLISSLGELYGVENTQRAVHVLITKSGLSPNDSLEEIQTFLETILRRDHCN